MNNNLKQFVDALTSRIEYDGRSEAGQDNWVIEKLRGKRNGFYVDCGAAHPSLISNTYRLEKEYEWNGICIEPNSLFIGMLKNHRNAIIVEKAVTNETGALKLRRESWGSSLLKNQDSFNPSQDIEMVEVECDLLQNILDEHNSPKEIDYLNLDIPGAELDVISSFDFSKYHVSLITVKDNPKTGDQYTEILLKNGYVRENNLWIDRCFVHKSVIQEQSC